MKMEALATFAQPFFAWLLETTLIAGMVICLILAAQKLLGRRLGPRWCHALWLVLLVRMVLPWAPPSPVSLFNLIPASIQRSQPQANVHAVGPQDRSGPVETSEATERKTVSTSDPTEGVQRTVMSRPEVATKVDRPPAPVFPAMRRLLPFLWLAGVVVLGGYLLASNFALWRIVKRQHPLINEQILELFEACKSQMGVQTIVALVPNDRIRTAALFGFVRPRLLLPREMVETASPEELRYVFLHELAHLKRHDIYIGWLASLLQVLHWFNPLVWLAFHQMRADRELACDALVLTRTHQEESHQYGQTIVALLGRFSRSRRLPAMAGILESQSQLKRRITMIAKFENNSYRWSPLAVTLTIALACVALPNARYTRAATEKSAQPTRRVEPVIRELSISYYTGGVSLSPAGDKLVCCRMAQGIQNLIVYDFATGKETQGTDLESGYAWNPVFSPDGNEIVYTHQRSSGGSPLHIVSLQNRETRALGHAGYARDWSRDGRFILVRSPDGNTFSILSVSGDTVERTEVPLPRGTRGWRISPNAKYVTCSYKGNLCLFPFEGGDPIQITKEAKADSQPVWSSDGRTLVFLSHRAFTPKFDLCAVAVVDAKVAGDVRILRPDIADKALLFGLSQTGRLLCELQHLDKSIYLAELNPQTGQPTGEPVRLAAGSNPVWSPDGKQVAYIAYEQPMLHVISADGSNDREITAVDFHRSGTYAWALDGDTIYIPETQVGPDSLAICISAISASTGKKRTVLPFDSQMQAAHLTCSPDGKRIAFTRCPPSSDVHQIFIIDVDGANLRQLTSADALNKFYPAWSPDGEEIAYMCRSGGVSTLTTVSVDDAITREVFRGRTSEDRFFRKSWSPDGSKIMWSTFEGLRIGDVSRRTHEPLRIGSKPLPDGPAWSPDATKMLYFTIGAEDLVLIDSFLPSADQAK